MNNALQKHESTVIPSLNIGDSFDNRLQILDIIEDGRIFLVRDNENTEKLFALKIGFREEIYKTPYNLRHEFIIHSHFDHPAIVKVIEPFETNEYFGYLMEYVGGGDLFMYKNLNSKHKLLDAIKIIYGIISGVAEIHSKNIVHADLKPENILLTTDFNPRITDFGVAKEMQYDSPLDNNIKGTLKYLCPWYVQSGKVDFTIDIYAIGLIAYELLSGDSPLYNDNPVEMFKLRLNKDIPSIGNYRNDIAPEFIKAIDICVKRRPNQRFKNAEELLSCLPDMKKSLKYSDSKKRITKFDKNQDKSTRFNLSRNKTKTIIEHC